MCEAKEREKWQHTSHLAAWTNNAFGGKAVPKDFDPFDDGKRRKTLDSQAAKDILKQLAEQAERRKAKMQAEVTQ